MDDVFPAEGALLRRVGNFSAVKGALCLLYSRWSIRCKKR